MKRYPSVLGFTWPAGSPYFITNAEKRVVELEDAYILIHEKKLSSLQPLLPILEAIVQAGKPMLIVAEDIEGEALATLAAVKAPGFGDRRKAMLGDIAVLTAGTMIAEDISIKLENVTLQMLGRAKRVRIEKENTTIIEGAGNKQDIKGRIAHVDLHFMVRLCTNARSMTYVRL